MFLILGANGQVGRALTSLLGPEACIAYGRISADLSDPEHLPAALEKAGPVEAVFNAAAYTAVDQAENDGPLAAAVNGESPGVIARWCSSREIPLVHYSTDYVFNGEGTEPWLENDPTAPLSVYGATKLMGERAIQEAGGPHLILRTSWVFDSTGKNFVNTMLRLGREREELRVVNDQHGAPTFAPHLAAASIQALQVAREKNRWEFHSGVYHLCHQGETTWYQFARAVFEQAKARGMPLKLQSLEPIATSDYPTPARRPLNSRLSCRKIREELGIALPHWQMGLRDCMEAMAL